MTTVAIRTNSIQPDNPWVDFIWYDDALARTSILPHRAGAQGDAKPSPAINIIPNIDYLLPCVCLDIPVSQVLLVACHLYANLDSTWQLRVNVYGYVLSTAGNMVV